MNIIEAHFSRRVEWSPNRLTKTHLVKFLRYLYDNTSRGGAAMEIGSISNSNQKPSIVPKRGDSLSSIAKKYGTTEEALLELNPSIQPQDQITGNRKIFIPVNTIVIKKGDTLGELAKEYGTTIDVLQKLNPIIESKHWIYAGKKLNVPALANNSVVPEEPETAVATIVPETTVPPVVISEPVYEIKPAIEYLPQPQKEIDVIPAISLPEVAKPKINRYVIQHEMYSVPIFSIEPLPNNTQNVEGSVQDDIKFKKEQLADSLRSLFDDTISSAKDKEELNTIAEKEAQEKKLEEKRQAKLADLKRLKKKKLDELALLLQSSKKQQAISTIIAITQEVNSISSVIKGIESQEAQLKQSFKA